VETQATAAPDQYEGVTEFVGYGPAAAYLGLQRNTLSSYVARGIGPSVKIENGEPVRVIEGQYVLPVFERSALDEWRAARPGQGARTDLVPAHS
jgi:hypothetical protein